MTNTAYVKELLKKVIELIMPDLDHYRRPLRKGRVIETYASDGKYLCDVEILLNNDRPDETEPIVKSVEIPVIWGGKSRGIICPPAVGTYCDVEYYHGDPDYPRISNFRWQDNEAPVAETDELIIQQQNGVYIRICANSDIELKTPANIKADVGGNVAVTINGIVTLNIDGNVTADIGGAANITVNGKTTLTSKLVDIDGSGGGGATGMVVTNECVCPITGAPHIVGSMTVKASK